ncbi:MAG: FKBP-type peptidyl-prolyl cis-trans isomerase [Prevotellaceae bacterium]|jgi:FKBP-type peptidyl-prolyl cis-trans isomerase|nr:FKBP-type peptidyl-prolyl cis-trans isomerase [Prevotellaceae bacterium]
MKHFVYLFLITFLLASCNCGNKKLSSASDGLDSVSYAIGVYEAHSTLNKLRSSQLEPDYDYLLAGIKEILNNDTVKKRDIQWAAQVINQYFLQLEKKKNVEFLEENLKKDSIKVLGSGLQYKVITEGTGISPKVSDSVRVKYKGTTINGYTFDSSRDEVRTMSLGGVIEGWKQGIPLMKEGAKYIFYIPASLAYGDQGAGGAIPGGATLIFEVELVSVVKVD